jgi:cadaverine:lysine antiporter
MLKMHTIKKIGLLTAIGVVAGNMMGSGIALLPANMAAIGSITTISWAIAFIGSLALAYVFARLGLVDPKQGGLVAYAGQVSPILGFQTGIMYWSANWIGNLAIAVTGISYLSVFFPILKHTIPSGLAVIGCVWIFTFINFWGADKVAKIVSVSVLLLLIPVVGTALLGWNHFSSQTFVSNWNVAHLPVSKAIFSGILLAIWSFIGVESASVGADLVNNPKRIVPLATLIGTAIAALVYIGSTTVISGMFPASVVAHSDAPFALSFGAILGGWVKPFVSAFTAVACLASLGSWMMLVGQAGVAAAKRGTLPKIFGIENKKGVPVEGLIINSVLMTLLMLLVMFGGKTSNDMFGELITVAALFTILPYFYSTVELIRIDGVSRKSIVHFIIAIIGAIFCFMVLIGAAFSTLIATLLVSLTCFILYAIKNREKSL